jgi:hypothetical protein
MAQYRGFKRTSGSRRTQRARWLSKRVSRRYSSSPAGRHRKLALTLFGISKKARAIGNGRHARAMSNLGRRALAIAKAEYRLWKKGQALGRRSMAAHRALRAW